MGPAVRLAGVVLELVTDGPMPTGLACLLAQLPAVDSAADATICHGAAGPAVPDRPADLELGRLALWIDEPDVHVRDVTGATAYLGTGRAELGGGGEQAANGFHALFLFALTHLLAQHDRFVLHGAGVTRGDRAFVVLGGSGAGKSTLAVAAVEAGWGLLSDDMVVLRQHGGALELAGVPRAVMVPADLEWTVPTSARDSDPRGRLFVDTALCGGWFAVGGTISVGHGRSAAGEVRRIDGQQVLGRVMGAYVSTMNPPLLRRFLPSAAALSRLPGWALDHGVDPASRRTVAAGLLTTAADEGL
jgi:hypothetical protein